MCGIFGVVGSVDEAVAQRCLDTLRHRGPDGAGLWRRPGITLGHRRLAILDLSDRGRQPMSYADGRYWITFNGEIYNFLELRQELEMKGRAFQSESDTEVLLAAFAEWGEGCLDRFNGMWAFAIWDAREKVLFLSRDRFGKKPLFYSDRPGEFAFASEMKALLPVHGSPRPNAALIRSGSRLFQYEATDECLIEGIKRLPPGYCAWYRGGELTAKRWWCTLDHLPEVPSRYDEQVERFRELFMDACRLRMRSDVPIGTALSGGLDSSATIACVADLARRHAEPRMGKSWQHAFVASFPDTPIDETPYARRVTEHLGIDATFIQIAADAALGDLERYLWLFEELYITSPVPFMLTYGQVKEHGISVTLDGHGADEVCGGYSFDFMVALADAGPNVAQVADIVSTLYDSYPQSSAQFPALPPKWFYLLRAYAKNAAKKILGRTPLQASRDSTHRAWGQLDYMTRQLYMSTHETVLPTLLRNYDRYSMANGVEIRMPFLDWRLVTFAFALPWSAKIRNGFSKAVVRDAVAQFMPREIAYRKAKIGFNSPVVDWMKGPMRAFLLDTLQDQGFRECDLLDPRQVATAVRHVINSPRATFADGERAWTLLSPYLWKRAFLEGKGATR